MTDKIPSFKEQIDEIHVPMEKLDDIIFKTVQEHAPKRKKSWRSKLVYSTSAAVVAFGLLVGSATVSPVMADFVSKIPIIGSIFSESDDVGLAQVSDLGFTHIVKESQTVGDKTLTVDEVFYDGTRFTLSYSFESETPVEQDYLGYWFSLDGENLPGSIGEDYLELTPTHRTAIAEIYPVTVGEEFPEKFQLGLHFDGKNGEKWDFTIPIAKKNNTQFIPVEYTDKIEGVIVSVSGLEVGPGGILIKAKSETKKYKHLESLLDFKVKDSLGNELLTRTLHGTSNTWNRLNYDIVFDPASSEATELIITPYINIPKQGEWFENDIMGNESEVDVSQYQDIDFTFESFTVELPN